VRYERLGLVVIDEQHRFGVAQRTRLREKGRSPDLLVMTATPIPRSLALTVYGDLNLSVIDKLPPGRKPVKTALRPLSAREKVYEFIRSEIKKKRQAYIVYPLVEESEKLNLKAATREFERLSEKVFPEFKLALIHGRLGPEEREQIASRFRNGKIDILVATTVIEVGVDVPRASIMLIENAERFGLSQLHQLRGRVGRGESQSYCILLADEKASETATERLKAIASTQDGFEIAEFDLRLRGPGEFLGERQHGLPEFRLADIIRDAELLKVARKYAFDIVSKKIKLPEKQGKLLKQTIRAKYSGLLSHLFGG
jgi:ATP-dependent DNA helicase RecG